MAAVGKEPQTVVEDVEMVKVAGEMQLSLDLRDALNKPESSDVSFICKNDEKVHACRWLLILRCPFFKGMFGHEMAESKASQVSLVQFSSSTMLCVLEFLYTGASQSHSPLSWKMGCEAICAAHFFMIPALEVIVQQFLRDKILKINKASDVDLVIDMLNEALEFPEPWEGKNALLLELLRDLPTSWGNENCLRKLSENALDFLLTERERGLNGRREQQCVEEYYVFRNIVLWQVYKKLPILNTEAREVLLKSLPSEKDEPSLWSAIFKSPLNLDKFACQPSSRCNSNDPTAALNSRLGIDVTGESFKRLLGHVKWFRIPAMLLLKVVYPLEVVPSPAILEALAFHALHRPVEPLANVVYHWKHSEVFKSDSNGLITCKRKGSREFVSGLAIACLPMPRSYGIYEWQFEIQEWDLDGIYITFGIYCGSDNHPWDELDLDAPKSVCCPATRLLTIDFIIGRTFVSKDEPKKDFWETWKEFDVIPDIKSPIRFTLNASEKTCQASFQASFGDAFETGWTDLPEAVYYPVLEVHSVSKVSVTIKVIRGFYFL